MTLTSNISPNAIDQLAPLLPPLPASLNLPLFPESLLNEASNAIALETLPDISPKSHAKSFSTSPSELASSPIPDWTTLTSSTSSDSTPSIDVLSSMLSTLNEVQTSFESVSTVYHEELVSSIVPYPCEHEDRKNLGVQAKKWLKMVKSLQERVQNIHDARQVLSSIHAQHKK